MASETVSEPSSTLASGDYSEAPAAVAINATAEWVSPATSPKPPESISLNEETTSPSESNAVSTVEYVEMEAETAAEIETASRVEEIDVANGNAEGDAPSSAGSPKFVRPGAGFSFVR